MNCKICKNSDNLKTFEVREMMFGLRDVFTYFQCPACGCLQISDIPEDMSEYYPPEYYSFTQSVAEKNRVKAILKKMRDLYAITGQGFPGMILNRLFPDEILSIFSGMPFESRILDVGCGSGSLIYRLKEAGFLNLLGIDPLNAATIKYDNGLIIEKKSVGEVSGKWDMITYHHSFEHLATPLKELKIVRELLSEKGTCIIRIPVVDSWAWEHYQTDWVQIDAPRHFFLYSAKSIALLADKAGLMIDRIEYDSTDFQFWGSEQYMKDIALRDKRSYLSNHNASMFSRREIGNLSNLAIKLNRNRKGDQAIFFLKVN